MRRGILVGLVLLVAVGAGVGAAAYWMRRPTMLTLPGVVEIQEVRVGSKLGGRVEKVLVEEGQTIPAGKELVRFAAPELAAQKRQLQALKQQAEAESAKADSGPRDEEKAIARAQLRVANVRKVKMDAGGRSEEKRQADANLAAAAAEAEFATREFARQEQMVKQRAASQSDYESARSLKDRAAERLRAAKAAREILEKNRMEDMEEADAEAQRAQANYLLLQETRKEDRAIARAKVAEIEAKLQEVEAHIAESVVSAPEPAVVEVVGVRPGDLVPPNQPVVRLLRAGDLWVKAYVPETELGRLRVNQAVEVRIDAYPGKAFAGKVIQVATISEFTPRNVQSADQRRHQVFGVKVRVDEGAGIFRAGMAAEVRVPLHDAGDPGP